MSEPTNEPHDFLRFMEERLDDAEGKTTDQVAVMKISAAEFALNGRRLIKMARDSLEDAS